MNMYNSINAINSRLLGISKEVDALWSSILFETSKDKIIEVHGRVNALLDEEEELSKQKCDFIINHLENK